MPVVKQLSFSQTTSAGACNITWNGWIGHTQTYGKGTDDAEANGEFKAHTVCQPDCRDQQGFIICVTGYSQFSIYAKDNNTTGDKHFKVFINGSEATKDISNSFTVRRYDLTPANTYIIRVTGQTDNNNTIQGFSLKLPDYPAPSALAASDITSSGATLTVTDSYETNYYELYVSEDDDTPAANADPSYSIDGDNSIDVDDLEAGTTYYAWVRSVCSDTRKSDWVALTGSYFTTTSSCSATANAGSDKETSVGVGVAMAATAASSGYTGAWSIKSGSPSTETSQLGTTSSNTMTFTPNTAGTYTLVWTVTDDSDGSCSKTDEADVTVSCLTAPVAVTSLTNSAHTTNSLTYTWTKASNASGYVATLYSDEDCDETPVASEELGDVATVTFSDLTPNTTYYCKVQSKGNGTVYCEDGGTTTTPVSGKTDAPSVGTFTPASGSTVKSETTVTVTGSTGSTVYYLWGTSSAPSASDVVSDGTAGTSGAATVTTSGISSTKTYLYAVAVEGGVNSAISSASYTIDDTAPTLSSSDPDNGDTGVEIEGTIVLTFSEALSAVDGTKFTLTNATMGAVAIDGSDNKKVNIAYSGADYSTTVTLATAAGAVADAAGNTSAALSSISFTTKPDSYDITEGSHSGGTIAIKDDEDNTITTAKEDDKVYITATPSTGYRFTSWSVTKDESGDAVSLDADDDSDGKTRSFTMPDEAVTVNATFTAINYRVKWSSANHARYTIQAEGGEATDGSVYANYGQTITLATTYVEDGYHLATWGVTKTDGGAAVDMATANTFVMPAEDVTIRPIFGKYYTVTFNSNGGSTTPSAQTQTAVGQALTMPAAPTYADHTFVCWMIGGTTVSAGGSYAPPADVTAYAIWKEDCDGGGAAKTTTDIAASGYSAVVEKGGASVTMTSTPSLGFKYNSPSGWVNQSTTSATRNNAYSCQISGNSSYRGTLKTSSSYSNVDSISFYFTAGGSSGKIEVWYSTDGFDKDSTSLLAASQIFTSNNVFMKQSLALPAEKKANSLTFKFRFAPTGSCTMYIDSLKVYASSGGYCKYVTYDGNGAAGGHTDDATAYASSATATVLSNSFTHPGYTFNGWNTKADGSGSSFAAASTFSITKDTTLYAQWSPATLTFTGEHSYDWTDPRNWTDAHGTNPACVPTINHDVILQHNATLYGPYADDNKGHGVARSVKIDKSTEELKDIKLSIWSEASLIVAKDIQAKHVGDADWGATTHHDLEIETSILGNGALITGDVSDNDVTYKFCTKAFTVYDADRGRNYYYNQYFGIPFTSTDATKQYYNCAIYEYGVETDSWITPTDGNTLHAFRAYNLLRRNITYSDNITLNGTLNLPGTDGEVLLECGWRAQNDETTIDANKSYQDFMFANSWTAPIVIAALDDDDCTDNLVQTIYMFNSGYQPDGEKIIGDDWGQWSAFPFKSSAYMDRAVIPATQAFLVTAKSEDATLTLRYGKHVYTPALEAGGANNYPTRAPRRTREESAPTKLKMMVMNDTVVADKLYIFEREDFTNEFDNGWDGTKMFGSSSAPQLYSQQGNGKMAVAAVPEMEGMEINFIAGTDTNKYTFKFEYADEEPLYLYDRDKLEFTRIEDGSTYTFTTDDNVAHARFMLTRSKSPWVATGVEPTNDKVVDTKVRKVLINNHIYIIRGDRVYSIEGILVK